MITTTINRFLSLNVFPILRRKQQQPIQLVNPVMYFEKYIGLIKVTIQVTI